MNSTLVKILIGIVYGLLLVAIAIPLSKKLILTRTEDPGETLPLNNKFVRLLISIASLLASLGVVFTAEDDISLVRNLLLLIPMINISIVDFFIKKIPNSLLLSMILIQGGYAAYVCTTEHSTKLLITIAFGFAVGFIGCTIPSILRLPVGAGDIKYSAMIGMVVYIAGYFQSMILMGIVGLILLVVLKITKKGDGKTMVPMGPLLSIGTVITMCYPLLNSLVDLGSMF